LHLNIKRSIIFNFLFLAFHHYFFLNELLILLSDKSIQKQSMVLFKFFILVEQHVHKRYQDLSLVLNAVGHFEEKTFANLLDVGTLQLEPDEFV